MKTQVWLWAACLSTAALIGCGDDSSMKLPPVPDNVPLCGNGVLNSGEACDDSNTINGDGCSSTCTVEPGYECDVTSCQMIAPSENCGNGVVDPGEVCDDANRVSGDGCLANCLAIEEWYQCPPAGGECSGIGAACGNGLIETGEQCDDNNLIANDGCSDKCRIESGYVCPDAGKPCHRVNIENGCGNGVVDNGEGCDDANLLNGDGCDDHCQVEMGWICQPGQPCVSTCGDGILVGTEFCDDGNNDDGDGCKGDCSAFEDGFDCENVINGTTACLGRFCGDGIVQSETEECDYGESSSDESLSNYGWNAEHKAHELLEMSPHQLLR